MLGGIRFFSLLVAGALPGGALACACCAEHGARFSHVIELGEWEVETIAALRASGPAQLYLTACGYDCVRGIEDPLARYGVEMVVSEAGVNFTLRDTAGGYRGTLGFDWPASYEYFGVDTDLAENAGEPALYTEIRFAGTATGLGAFAADGPAAAELVLSGFGNMCITPQSFQGWSLSVSGAGAEYRLYGPLSQ